MNFIGNLPKHCAFHIETFLVALALPAKQLAGLVSGSHIAMWLRRICGLILNDVRKKCIVFYMENNQSQLWSLRNIEIRDHVFSPCAGAYKKTAHQLLREKLDESPLGYKNEYLALP